MDNYVVISEPIISVVIRHIEFATQGQAAQLNVERKDKTLTDFLTSKFPNNG